MSGHGIDDGRLERELRGMLRDRDAGPAPYGLRGRVHRIPDEVPAPRRRPGLVRVAPFLAAAAVLGVLVVGLAGAGRLPGSAGSGAGDGSGTTGPATEAVFDPTAMGLGVVSPLEAGFVVLLVLVAVALWGLALASAYPHERRRFVAIGVAAAVGVAVLSLVPGPAQGSAWGTADGTDASAPGTSTVQVVAGPEEPYQVLITLANRALLPIHVDGFVEVGLASAQPSRLSAWTDDPANGRPGQPFTGANLGPGEEVGVWIVQLADPCAAGPGARPLSESFRSQSTLRVRWSVLLWPRETDVDLPFTLETAMLPGCPGGVSP